MVKFYQTFPIVQTLSAQLSWSHYLLILKLEDDKAKEFVKDPYIRYSKVFVRTWAWVCFCKPSKKNKLYLPTVEELKEELEKEKILLESIKNS